MEKPADQLVIPEVDANRAIEQRRALSMRSDRLRSLGEMAAGIAHELSQPLVTVRGAAEHMMIGLEDGWDVSPDRLNEKLSLIIDQADRMVHIIEHVRMFAREAGKPSLSVVDLNTTVQTSIDLVSVQFRSHGVTLEMELAEDIPKVYVNPYSLEEVLLNLLTNARDAVEARSPASPLVVVRTGVTEDGKKVFVEVRDNGVGLASEVEEKIWDPFFTTKDPDKGTGLGLSISKSIVEGFSGSIQASANEDSGINMTVLLPAYRESDPVVSDGDAT
jgi:C4-dicarboxylate-specific signal transduction histidine kinase